MWCDVVGRTEAGAVGSVPARGALRTLPIGRAQHLRLAVVAQVCALLTTNHPSSVLTFGVALCRLEARQALLAVVWRRARRLARAIRTFRCAE